MILNKTNFKISLFLFLLSITVHSQNLPDGIDQEFLNSLPEGMRDDLLKRISQKKESEQPQYRRPSTFVDKDLVNSEDQRYGANIFQSMQSTLMPINEPNFDGSYLLDFGDVLELQLIGQDSSISQLKIKRDGSINIENIGNIFVSGLTLESASELIKSRISQSFIGIEAFVSLVNVRDIQVILAGNVFNPGIYTLNGNSNIFHALSVAGGPSVDGSFREINLIRNNEIIDKIDLYDTFIYGKSSFNKRLRSGDTVFVTSIKNSVTASGAFKRPGIYELLDSEKLSSLLNYTNGLTAYADLNNISLQRVLDGRITPLSLENLDDLDSIDAKDADNLFIRNFPFRSISINGAVLNPGTYLMNEGDTIQDVIIKAGGYLENAYPFGGIYENDFTKDVNEQANLLLYEKFLENIIEMTSQGQGSGEQIKPIIELFSELRNSPTSGRIIVDFESKDKENQTLVREGDQITIPEYINQVYLYGELSSQGAAEFVEGKSIDFYIEKVGGLNKFADTESIFIYQPNGESLQFSKNRNIFQSQNEELRLYAGTIIYVPRKINNEYLNRLRTQAYASIISSMGVSLASISVLRD